MTNSPYARQLVVLLTAMVAGSLTAHASVTQTYRLRNRACAIDATHIAFHGRILTLQCVKALPLDEPGGVEAAEYLQKILRANQVLFKMNGHSKGVGFAYFHKNGKQVCVNLLVHRFIFTQRLMRRMPVLF